MSKPRTQRELDAINAIHETLERFTGKLGRIDHMSVHFQNGVERKIDMHGPGIGGYRSINDYATKGEYDAAYGGGAYDEAQEKARKA